MDEDIQENQLEITQSIKDSIKIFEKQIETNKIFIT